MTSLSSPTNLQPEMPVTRWGDPARASDLPDSVRDLVSLVFPVQDTPARTDVSVPAPRLPDEHIAGLAALIGTEHVVTDDVLRRRTTLTIRGLATDEVRAKVQDLLEEVRSVDAVATPTGELEALVLVHQDAEIVDPDLVRSHDAIVFEKDAPLPWLADALYEFFIFVELHQNNLFLRRLNVAAGDLSRLKDGPATLRAFCQKEKDRRAPNVTPISHRRNDYDRFRSTRRFPATSSDASSSP